MRSLSATATMRMRLASASASMPRRSISALLSITLACACASAFFTVVSFCASASRRDCSICFCFSGRVNCMASASDLAWRTLTSPAPWACFTCRTRAASASSSAIFTSLAFISVSTPMPSFCCSFSSRPSRPLAYSSGNWTSRSITSFTIIPSAPSFRVMRSAAVCRISSRLVAKTSRTV